VITVQHLNLQTNRNAGGRYKNELNFDNPIGHGGSVAKVYADLLENIYSGDAAVFAPRSFKNTIGRAQPIFSGYGQQDSQEFLSFLVDGLHEDLNRIHKKPYFENPDSTDEMVGNKDAIRLLGETYRDNHRARNDSIAMDLFNGFYKNTMVCPECEKVSITFDPFSILTLQLPFEQGFQHTITFAPLKGFPFRIEVDVDKNSSIRQLKEYVSKRVQNLDWKKLMCAEIFSHKFYKTFEDKQTLAELNVQPRDEIFLFELEDVPSNFPPPKKKTTKFRSMLQTADSSDEDVPEGESSLAKHMLVPLFHRSPPKKTSYSKNLDLVLWPSFIMVTPEEAQDEDTILRKVLGRIDAMTTRNYFGEVVVLNDAALESANGSDTVITTEEDASSTIDSTVQANSVGSEDELVDVSMQDLAQSNPDVSEKVNAKGRYTGSITKPLRDLFELRYLKVGSELVQTGWSNLDGKEYPSVASRIPRVPSAPSTPSSSNQDPLGDDEDEEQDDGTFSYQAQSIEQLPEANGSVESEDELPELSQLKNNNRAKFNKRKQKQGLHTSSYKGNRISAKSIPKQSGGDGKPALIRLGEALVIDWDEGAFDGLFNGSNADGERGRSTLSEMETFEDPSVANQKQRRDARKKHGVSLEECFDETAKSEILSEDNAWFCSKCKELRRAEKTLSIFTAPDILVLNLKRFSSQRRFNDKVDIAVDFPVEGLDLSERVDQAEGKSLVYDLFAVDNHYGGLGGGHYTAYAKNFFDEEWYEYNGKCSEARTYIAR